MKKYLCPLKVGRFLAILALCTTVSAARAENLLENFDSGWTYGAPMPGTHSNAAGWIIDGGFPFNFFPARSGSGAGWLVNDSSYLQSPLLTNGIGNLTYWAHTRTASETAYSIQISTNDTASWDTVQAGTNTPAAQYNFYSIPINTYDPTYVRIVQNQSAGEMGLDDVQTTNPPAKIIITNPDTSPEVIYANKEAYLTCDLDAFGLVSGLVVTSYWRAGVTGPWTGIEMSNTAGNAYESIDPVPGQDSGATVYYTFNAVFSGPSALSPTNFPSGGTNDPSPYTYTVAAPLYLTDHDPDNFFVIGDFQTNMLLVGDYSWEGFVALAAPVVDGTFRFRALSTNLVTTNFWGDDTPIDSDLPIEDTADEGAGTALITVNGTNSGQFMFRFTTTNRYYSVRQCVQDDFEDRTTSGYENTTNDGWVATSANIILETDRNLRGNACYLDNNGSGTIRSPYLPEGVGEVSFWYRNWEGDGSPDAEVYIQVSKTGSTDPGDWTTVQTLSSINATNYNRAIVPLNTRYYNYARILNSTAARVCLDEVTVSWPGAGVEMTNLVANPAAPTRSNPIDISVDVLPEAGASNLTVTAWWRPENTGAYTSISMSNVGNTYTTTTPIPAGSGPGDGAGNIEYFISCTYLGFEYEYGSPTYYLEDTNTPQTVLISPAQVLYSNVVTDPLPPYIGSNILIKADLYPVFEASNLNATLYYSLDEGGSWSNTVMTNLSGNTYVGADSIPSLSAPGLPVWYRIETTFEGPSAVTPTNYPGPSAAEYEIFVFRTIPVTSTYTNMSVTTPFSTNLLLVSNGVWQGVATVSTNIINTSFLFSGVNGGTTTWGDNNQAYNTLPVFGETETGSNNIEVNGTNTGYFVFQRDESDGSYSAQRCEYVSFDGWTESSYGTYTNGDGWVINEGRTTTAADYDLRRVFRGRSCILDQDNGPQYLRSPYLTEGVGNISFWYRNWGEDGAAPITLYVEMAASAGGPWIEVARIEDIYSVDYTHFMVQVSSRNNNYIRIRRHDGGGYERVCLDDVVVAEPGADVAFTSLDHAPSNPTANDPVTVSVDIDPLAGATSVDAILRYRSGTWGAYFASNMTAVGNTWSAIIPAGLGDQPGGAGTVQYYVECTFDGFQSDLTSPNYAASSTNPASYVIIPATVAISNVVYSPVPPVTGTNIMISADISGAAGATDISPTLYYRVNGGPWDTDPMYVSGGNTYTTTNGITPISHPGSLVEYYVRVDFSGPSAITPTNYPAAGYTSLVVRAAELVSSYTNMIVTAPFNLPLGLIEDSMWYGAVAMPSNINNTTFTFQSMNGGTINWGDDETPSGALPVFGIAEDGGTVLPISSGNTNIYAFRFNELNNEYSAQRASYVDFDAWSTLAGYNTYTNSDGWVIENGRTTTASGDDVARTLRGKSCILNQAGASPYVRSPERPTGIGEISFWYRNWETDALTPGEVDVQVATSSGGPWSTVASITNILTPDYVHFTHTLSDRDNRYARIICDMPATRPRICLDEIVVSDPGPGVTFANLEHSPTNPSVIDEIEVTVEITPQTYATNLQATLWYRIGTNGNFESISMSNTGGVSFVGDSLIPRGDVGIMQYYIECQFEGMRQGVPVYAYYPPAGSAGPASYSNRNEAAAFEDFDSGWTYIPSPSTYSNAAGWVLNGGFVFNSFPSVSSPGAGWLTIDGGYLQSPLASSGVGLLSFSAHTRTVSEISFGVYVSTNGTASWDLVLAATNTPANQYNPYSIPINTYVPTYVRIVRTEPGGELGLDDVLLTYPSARVGFSDFMIHPGYVGPNDPVDISCTITSAPGLFSAFNISARVYYGTDVAGSPSGPIEMTRNGTRFTTTTPIPADFNANDVIQYYVESTFGGYHYDERSNYSPSYSPTGRAGVTNTQYYLPPTTGFHTYSIRPFSSSFDYLSVTSNLGVADMQLVGDYTWQASLDPDADQLTWTFLGFDQYTNGALGYSDTVFTWGDTNQIRVIVPTSGQTEPGSTTPIVINIDTNQRNNVIIRYNVNTGSYLILRGSFQDFNDWSSRSFTKYAESLDLSDVQTVSTNFENWTVDEAYVTQRGTDLEDFQTWPTNYSTWVGSPTFDGGVGWVIDDALIFREFTTNQACRMRDDVANLGGVWPNKFVVTDSDGVDGIKDITFDYRCKFDEHYHTVYTNGGAWSNYQVTVDFNVTEVSPDLPYVSIYALYQDETHYYEYRLAKHRADAEGSSEELALSLWVRNGASPATRISDVWESGTGVGNTLLGSHTCTFLVVTNNTPYMYLEGYHNGFRRVAGDDCYESGPLYNPGTIGLFAKEAAVRVDNVNVKHVDVQRFEQWNNGSYGNYTNNSWVLVDARPNNGDARIQINSWPTYQSKNFDTDSTDGSFTSRALGIGWFMSNGRVLAGNNQSSPNVMWLSNSAGAYIRTPQLTQGVGDIKFYTRNTNSVTITYKVQTSPTGAAPWTDIKTFNHGKHTSWTQRDVDITTTNSVSVRILKTSSDGAGEHLEIDSITVDRIRLGSRYIETPLIDYIPGTLTFRFDNEGGSGNAYCAVFASSNGVSWELLDEFAAANGQADRTYPGDGGVADITPYRQFRIENWGDTAVLRIEDIYITENSAFYSDNFDDNLAQDWNAPYGHWYTQFQDYGRDGYLGPEIGFAVNKAITNGTTIAGPDPIYSAWEFVEGFTASNLNYQSEISSLYSWEDMFVQVQHTSGVASLVVDELSLSSWRGRTRTNGGWTATEAWVTDVGGDNGRVIQLDRRRAKPDAVQAVSSPYQTNGVGTVYFDYFVANAPAVFQVQSALTPATNIFLTVETVTNSVNGWHRHAYAFNNSTSMFVRVRHTSTNWTTQLWIDNVDITDFSERDDTMWYAYNALITYSEDSREFEPYADEETSVMTAYLNNSPTADTLNNVAFTSALAYVQSPEMPQGIGELSFWHREFTGGGNPATVTFAATTNWLDPPEYWTELGSLTITNSSYEYFTTNWYLPQFSYLRIYCSNSPSDRVCLDNITMTQPVGADFQVGNVTFIPDIPLYNQQVNFSVDLTSFLLSPSNEEVRVYFHVGTNLWGDYESWNPADYLVLTRLTANTPYLRRYESPVGIPQQPIDEVVQYYVSVTYQGLFATNQVPYPKRNTDFENPEWYEPTDLNDTYGNPDDPTPYYFSFSCRPEEVWINEYNIYDGFFGTTYQYIELIGRSAINISNWWIEIINSSDDVIGHYSIVTNSIFGSDYNGYGFWVLGQNTVTPRDMTLTNGPPALDGTYEFRLRRSMGAYEHWVTNNLHQDAQIDMVGLSVSMVGTGALRDDFSFSTTTPYSLNTVNTNQYLLLYSATQTMEVVSFYGGAVPPVGIYTNERGTRFECSVTNSPLYDGVLATQYLCTGWIGTGDVPATGASTNGPSFLLVTNSSITWTWATNVYLQTSVVGDGSVDKLGWYSIGSAQLVTATPDLNNRFVEWTGDTNGCTISSNTITVPMTQPRGPVTANFESTDRELIVVSAQGMADPAVGIHTNNDGTIVTCQVTNPVVTMGTTQYVCTGWVGTGSVPDMPVIGPEVTVAWSHASGYPNWPDTYASQDGSGWIAAIYADGGNYVRDNVASNGLSTGDDYLVTNITVFSDANKVWWTGAQNVDVDDELSIYSVIFNSTTLAGATHYAVLTNGNDFFSVPVTNVAYNCGTAVAADWQPLGSPYTGVTAISTGPFAHTNDSSITWNWSTNYWLNTETNGNGTVDVADGWIEQGSNVVIMATPAPGQSLGSWSGDTNGCIIAGDQITVPMDQPRTITANFEAGETAQGTPYWWLELHFPSEDPDVQDTNDFDVDGLLTWMEYITGTDPTNPGSVFAILNQGSVGSSNFITFYGTTNSGRTNYFGMYRATNLLDPSPWTLIVTSGIPRDPSGTNTWWDTNPPSSDAPAFYAPTAD